METRIINGGQQINAKHIKNIVVRQLFGRYNYTIQFALGDWAEYSKIALLYGDNGSGKTTILKLLFDLLSGSDNRGHRGNISRVPFKLFKVEFTDGTIISASRKDNVVGSYFLNLSDDTKEKTGIILPNSDGRVYSSTLDHEALVVLEELYKLHLSIYFLGDDRLLKSDEFEDDAEVIAYQRMRRDLFENVSESNRKSFISTLDGRTTSLRQSLERTSNWLRRRSIIASSRGEVESQQIYANIVETINRIGSPQIEKLDIEKTQLIRELVTLEERSILYQGLGLIPAISSEKFVENINKSTIDSFAFVSQVVRSYIDGQKARLDSLEELYYLLSKFLELVNGFLRDKQLIINAREGVSIVVNNGEELKPEYLSSGEIQLLLLLFNVLTASENASIFIIDEPELSLNVKWQRKLVDSLLAITENTTCQFILATHSIELLTKHRNAVIKLSNY